MSNESHRWEMVAIGEPMVRTPFDPGTPGDGEVVIEVAGCGVCHTDLGYLYDGVRTNQPLPLTLGHEISGRVVATGAGAEAWQGRAVLVPAVTPCGSCDLCLRDLSTICRGQKMPGNDIHGGFGTHIVVSAVGLCPVDEARLTAAGLQLADVSVVADAVTTPYKAVLQADVKEGDLAVVVGVGGVGGYAVQIAAAFGATVIAVDIDQAKLDIMRQYGAAHTLNAREISGRDLRKAVLAYAKEHGLRSTEWKIFECSGTSAGQQTAFGLLTFGAHLAVVGFTMDTVELRLSNLMAFHAKAQGNWGCETTRYPDALDLVLDGRIALAPFIERHPMEQINQVFADVHAHKLTRRAIMVPG